ncbi:hypothetical protein [Alkalicoccobacillus gibsonii]|uniref:hypothetical protein n=1 Tax=Alkalicoccobacillus gibsonii TaxID=79881 RepID=UPI003519B6FA
MTTTIPVYMTKEEWFEYLAFFEKLAIALPPETRKQYVEELIDLHFVHFHKYPDSRNLQRLADMLLVEQLKDPDPDKMTKEEYPFLSDRQEDKRKQREMSMESETIDYMNVKYRMRLDSTFKKRTENKDD